MKTGNTFVEKFIKISIITFFISLTVCCKEEEKIGTSIGEYDEYLSGKNNESKSWTLISYTYHRYNPSNMQTTRVELEDCNFDNHLTFTNSLNKEYAEWEGLLKCDAVTNDKVEYGIWQIEYSNDKEYLLLNVDVDIFNNPSHVNSFPIFGELGIQTVKILSLKEDLLVLEIKYAFYAGQNSEIKYTNYYTFVPKQTINS